jgi:Purine catabolism regulatory protein-like family/PucR C-terminal helix-turn-helix domain/GGDEF-like domain
MHLADLLAEETFGLELLTGGSQAPVRGAHAVEVDAPARWLAADWVMLTTGVRLRGNVEAQRALVPQLQDSGVSALGFGVGLGFKRVPPALVEVASENGFPVFAVPYETPFREIIHYIDSTLSDGDEHVFRRLTALQRYLVDALRTPQPERAMVERLAKFLDASVVLLGDPDCVAGKPPPAALLAQVDGQGLIELEVDGWHAVATPVVTDDERWLVLASQRPGFISKLAKPAAEATAPLLAALTRLGDVVRDQEQAVKGALLAEALEPVAARDVPPLSARAAAFGIDFTQPARLVIVRGVAAGDLAARLDAHHISHLVQRREDSLTALVQGADADVLAALGELGGAIGVGRAVGGLVDLRHSLRDAELAASHCRGGIVRFEDFDLGTFMVSEIPPDRLGPKVDEILSVLRANPPLHEALRAYFDHDLDIAATAASLHMHRNSLRYRLARVEQVLGRSLKQPSTVAAVYIALVAEAVETP